MSLCFTGHTKIWTNPWGLDWTKLHMHKLGNKVEMTLTDRSAEWSGLAVQYHSCLSVYQVLGLWGYAFSSYRLHIFVRNQHTNRHVQSGMPLLLQMDINMEWSHIEKLTLNNIKAQLLTRDDRSANFIKAESLLRLELYWLF